jgi:hypothetical protein
MRAHRTGRYVVALKRHVIALVDGVVHDATGARNRVMRAWAVHETPRTQTPLSEGRSSPEREARKELTDRATTT